MCGLTQIRFSGKLALEKFKNVSSTPSAARVNKKWLHVLMEKFFLELHKNASISTSRYHTQTKLFAYKYKYINVFIHRHTISHNTFYRHVLQSHFHNIGIKSLFNGRLLERFSKWIQPFRLA